jgi:hypothetical protein
MAEPTIGLNLSTNRDHFSLHTVIFLSYGALGEIPGIPYSCKNNNIKNNQGWKKINPSLPVWSHNLKMM